MALTLEKGRPKDTAGRLDKEIAAYDFLDGLGVEYDRVDHEPLMTCLLYTSEPRPPSGRFRIFSWLRTVWAGITPGITPPGEPSSW